MNNSVKKKGRQLIKDKKPIDIDKSYNTTLIALASLKSQRSIIEGAIKQMEQMVAAYKISVHNKNGTALAS